MFNYAQDGVYDADIHIDVLDSTVIEGGRSCFVLCDALLPPLKMGNFTSIHWLLVMI